MWEPTLNMWEPAQTMWEPAMRATTTQIAKKPAIAGFFVARMAGSPRLGSYKAGSYVFSAIAAFIAAIVAA